MKKTNEPVDGRANPAAFDLSKVKEFRAECGAKAQNKKRVAEVTSTPVRHQSGKGIRSVREQWRGYSKVGLIRFCAAQSFDYDKTAAFIGRTFQAMTPAVFAKAWREGLAGEAPEVDRETAAIVRRECK